MTSTQLHRYVYVRACMIDEMLSFTHCWVNARDEDHAYRVGAHKLAINPAHSPVNDYVFLDDPTPT